MIETLKHMLTIGPVKVIFDNHNNNREGFLYKRGETSLGPLTAVVFSYIQVAGNSGNCFVCLCTIDGKKCTRNIPELQLRGEIKAVGIMKNVTQPVRLLTSKWLFHG